MAIFDEPTRRRIGNTSAAMAKKLPRRVELEVPPGSLGLTLVNGTQGARVSAISHDSPFHNRQTQKVSIKIGWELVSIDGTQIVGDYKAAAEKLKAAADRKRTLVFAAPSEFVEKSQQLLWFTALLGLVSAILYAIALYDVKVFPDWLEAYIEEGKEVVAHTVKQLREEGNPGKGGKP